MAATPHHVVRRADGAEAARLYDLPHQRLVGLHVADPDLLRLLVDRGVLAPRRPPFLDASDQGVHGGYQPRPQINWFLAPPIDEVAAALAEVLRAEDDYEVVPAEWPPLHI